MKIIHQDPELRAQRVAAIKVRCHATCFIGMFLLNEVVDLGMFVFFPMLLNMKRTKGSDVARKRASEIQKAFFSDPENRLKRSIAMKG
jgi:hypothetical protein